MIVYRDGPMNWIAERETGEKIPLTYNEIQDIYWFMRRETLWEEVTMRMEDIDANDAAGGTEIAAVEKKKDSILDYMMAQEYRTDDVMGDIVWDAIQRFCPDIYLQSGETKEYAVEIFSDGEFLEQVDVCTKYRDAVALAKAECLKLADGEEIHITTIVYNEYGDEIEHYCDAAYDRNDA